jgi:hypothetical protein
MKGRVFRSFSLMAAVLLAAIFVGQTVFAGPPLICHPYEIGDAKSLPWSRSEWRTVKADYDLNRLVDDTLALLGPETPVLVRMETMRRATIYSVWAMYDREVGYLVKDKTVSEKLLARLMDRVRQSTRDGKPDALALFDAGYLAASYKDARAYAAGNPENEIDGYGMIVKASAMRGGDPEMEFAAALAVHRGSLSKTDQSEAHRRHLQKALAGAKDGSLLARNLVTHFGQRGQSIADLRSQRL